MNFDPIFYPYYAHLTPVQKSLYSILCSAIHAATEKVDIDIDCVPDDVYTALRAIRYERPAFFWMTGSSSTTTVNGKVKYATLKYNSLVTSRSKHNEEIKKAVSSYIINADAKSVLQAELIIHNAMAKNINYHSNEFDQNIYSAFVMKQSVCAGYSRAFQFIMQAYKIPCFYCHGTAKARNETTWGAHAWNIIKLGNDYYNVDLTWNDQFGDDKKYDYIDYTYFNCTDSSISSNHKRDPESLILPKCVGTKYSYEGITGITPELERVYQDGVTCRTEVHDHSTFLSVVTRELKKAANMSTVEFSFPVKGKATADSAEKWFKEAIDVVYGKKYGWKYSYTTTNYNNGMYRLKFTFTLKK